LPLLPYLRGGVELRRIPAHPYLHDLPWTRVHDLPDFAFFDHAVHIHKGIGCSSCHGRVDRMQLTAREKPLTMRWCLDCHRVPERYLRPREEVFDMDWQPPADQGAKGKDLLAQYRIPSGRMTDCSVCHR
jgi:hypothetical protein